MAAKVNTLRKHIMANITCNYDHDKVYTSGQYIKNQKGSSSTLRHGLGGCTGGSSSARAPFPLCTLELGSVLFCFLEGKFSTMQANIHESIVNEIGPAKEIVKHSV